MVTGVQTDLTGREPVVSSARNLSLQSTATTDHSCTSRKAVTSAVSDEQSSQVLTLPSLGFMAAEDDWTLAPGVVEAHLMTSRRAVQDAGHLRVSYRTSELQLTEQLPVPRPSRGRPTLRAHALPSTTGVSSTIHLRQAHLKLTCPSHGGVSVRSRSGLHISLTEPAYSLPEALHIQRWCSGWS